MIRTILSSLQHIRPIYYVLTIVVFVLVFVFGRWVESGYYFASGSSRVRQFADTVAMKLNEKYRINWLAISAACAFLFLVLSSVVLSRHHYTETFKAIPFWSYYEIAVHGYKGLLIDDILNVILMIPLGFLLAVGVKGIALRKVVLVTLIAEVFFEVCQLIFSCGLFEWDDIIHGCAGSALGWLLWKLVRKILSRRASDRT